ncbi:hypothetical protein HUC22_23850, partial [Escherichia coli]|nr:hypothetical protein [Escherichia coli]
YGHGACVEQDDKGWDARKRAYCLKIQPATGSFARNLIYSTKPFTVNGMVGQRLEKDGVALTIADIKAKPGTQFVLSQRTELEAI